MHRVAVAWVLGMSTLVTAQVADAQPRWGRPTAPGAGACFYRDAYFRGDYFCATAGEDIAFLPGGMNDRISSIRVFGNAEIAIFQDPRFRGRWTRLEGDVRDLRREGWNDRLSSVRITSDWGRNRGQGQYDDRRGRSGIGRIESGEWRDDRPNRDDRGDWRDNPGAGRYEPTDRNDRAGAGRNAPNDRNDRFGVGRNDQPDRPVDPRNSGVSGRRGAESADVIVRRLYLEILQREPDAQGLNLYRNHINNDRWSEQDVRDALVKSPEYRQRSAALAQKNAEATVARAYRSVLNRDPDPASRVYVDKILRENWTEADVVRELRNSPEFRNKR